MRGVRVWDGEEVKMRRYCGLGAHDTAIDLVLVGQVSATERGNACLRLEAEAGLAGWIGVGGSSSRVGAVMRRDTAALRG